jgi:hypothetical protein
MTQIRTLEELSAAANAQRAVYCPTSHSFTKPRPAAFVISMHGRTILHMFNSGMFIYTKPKSK